MSERAYTDDQELDLAFAEAVRLIVKPPDDPVERDRRSFNLDMYWKTREERSRGDRLDARKE